MGTLVHVKLSEPIRKVLSHFAEVPVDLELPVAGQAGSGRKYFRIAFGAKTWILQQSHSADLDFDRFVNYCNLFASLELSTPKIHAVDKESWQVLLDDLGNTQLWDICCDNDPMNKQHPDAAKSEKAYFKTLAALTKWQECSDMAFAENAELASREFDFTALRWETNYFSEHYLDGLRKVDSQKIAACGPLFDQLAQRVAAHPRGLMHRDFQSQNVMMNPRGDIGFVDFQGARRGSLYYDVASLLWDPYVQNDLATVQKWFERWVKLNPLLKHEDIAHWNCFLEASLQRVMQALGAYCNLSRNKGIQAFAQHIKPGEAKLAEVIAAYSILPGSLDLQSILEWMHS